VVHFDDDTYGPADIGAKPINVQMVDAQHFYSGKDGKHRHPACRAACLPVASSPLSPDRLFATAVATFDAQQPSKPTCGAVLLAWRVFPTLSADRVLCFAVFEGPPGPHSEGTSKVRNGDFVKITVLGSKPDQCQDCGGSMATKEHFYVDVLSVTVFGIVTGTSLSKLHWYPVQLTTQTKSNQIKCDRRQQLTFNH